jgi:glycosyltransferase involved in cell wall biosynthesis
MSTPVVSVIIPNYNHSPYLTKRIESVLNQTFQDFEVIILDDCSTDSSREILESFRTHPKVSHLIFNDENSGLIFKQWNKGIRLAKGEFIWIAESDDFADLTLLETLVSKFTSDQTGIVFCNSFFVNNIGEISSGSLADDHWQSDYSNNGKDELINYFTLDYCPILNVSSVLMRKSFIELAGYAPEKLKRAGDWMFYTKLLQVCDIVFVRQPLNYFRFHVGKKKVPLDWQYYLYDRFKIFFQIYHIAKTDKDLVSHKIKYLFVEYTSVLYKDLINFNTYTFKFHLHLFLFLIRNNFLQTIKSLINAIRLICFSFVKKRL